VKTQLRKLTLSFAVILGITVMQSCVEKHAVEPQSVQSANGSTPSVLEEIRNLGFDTNVIQDKGGYYLAEGDIYFSKNRITARKLPVKSKSKAKPQPGQRQLIITIGLDQQVASNMAWKNGVDQAIENWNANQDHHFRFEIVTRAEDADIYMQDDKGELPDDIEIASEFAAHGYVGSTIRINLDYSASIPDQLKTKALEGLSHSVGLSHADLLVKDTSKTQASAKTQFAPLDFVYIINGDYIYAARKVPNTGQNYVVSSSWAGSTRITSTGGVLYIIQFDGLYVATTDGGWWLLSAGWSGTEALTNAYYDAHSLYAMQDNWLYGISADNGTWWAVSNNGYTSTPWSQAKFICATTQSVDDIHSAKNGLTIIDRTGTSPVNCFVCTEQGDPAFGTRYAYITKGVDLRGIKAIATNFYETNFSYCLNNNGSGIPNGIFEVVQGGVTWLLPPNPLPAIDWSKTQALTSDSHLYFLVDGGLYSNYYNFGENKIVTLSWPHVWLPTAILTTMQ